MFFVDEGQRARLIEEFEAAAAARAENGISEFHGAEGSKFWEAQYRILYNSDGRMRRIAGVTQDVTARKRAEETLREEQHFTTSLFATAPSITYIFDLAEQRNVFLSPQVTPVLGYSASEIQAMGGDFLIRLMHSLDLPRAMAHFERMMASRDDALYEFEYRMQRKDGTLAWFLSRDRVYERASDGTPLQILGSATDITQLKNTEDAIKASETRIRALIEQLPLLVHTIDCSGQTTGINPAFEKAFGVPARDMLGRNILEEPYLLPGDTRILFQQALGGNVAHAAPVRYGAAIMRGKEKDAWIEMTAYPVKDQAGAVSEVVVLYQDVTERVEAELAFAESSAVLDANARNSVDIIFAKHADGRLAFINDAVARQYGRSAAELIGHDDYFYLDAAEADLLRSHDRRVMAKGEPETVEEKAFGIDFLVTKSPWFDAGGKLLGLVGIARDISDRKLAEEKIRLLMHEVNHRSKNLLAVVQAIANRMTRNSDPDTFADRFGERLQALASSHDLLVRNSWQGVNMDDLVRSQLAHFQDLLGARIVARGAKLKLSAAAAQILGMALHELATNAGKYGSLSNEEGRLTISWTFDGAGANARCHMRWKESGGPAFEPPKASGFGSTVIKRMVEAAVGGEVVLQYAPRGFVWELDVPLANIIDVPEKAIG